ncbi:hypothetical protein WJ970_28305 [Achromobacter xylosoxidans]
MFYLIQANPEKNAAGACRTGAGAGFRAFGQWRESGLPRACPRVVIKACRRAWAMPGVLAGVRAMRARGTGRCARATQGKDLMRFLNSMPARIRALVALVVVLAGVSLVARFDDGQERRFESYDAMRAEGQGSYTWFPVFLPASARQIVLYTRVDTNYFHAGFSLDAKAMADFDVHLKTGASAEGLRLLREQQRGIGRPGARGRSPRAAGRTRST